MTRGRWYAALVAALLLAAPARHAHAAPQGPASVPTDTLAGLRAAVHAHPDSFELLLGLGRFLSRHADEVEGNWQDRVEAAGLFDRAVRIRSHDARLLLEYGLLLRKQRVNVDGMRVLKRAEDAAAKQDSLLSPSERADLHEQMALLYQTWWEDWAGLARQLEELKYDDRDAMMYHFAAAFGIDSNRTSAAVSWLRWQADWQKWAAYVPVAEALARHRPDDPEAWLFLGLGYHESGQSKAADTAFARAIQIADMALRTSLLAIAPLLHTDEARRFALLSAADQRAADWEYWQQRDPLFLTGENERIAEHFARVAYADLVFTDPADGFPGRNTAPGRIWLWYGRPSRVSMARAPGEAAGRYITWRYGNYFGPHRPCWVAPDTSFTFSRFLTYRHSALLPTTTGICGVGLDALRAAIPEWYRPTHPKTAGKIVFQAARFRGAEGKTELALYGRIPVDSLGRADSIQTGFFAFALNPWKAATSGKVTVAASAARRPAHFVAQLDPGQYLVSIEALGNDRASTARDTVLIRPRGTGLELSDLLLADGIAPHAATPRTRDDLAIDGSTTLTFRSKNPIGVVWELYGLATDTLNTARYHVQLEVRDTRGGLVRTLRTLTLQGNARETSLSWDAERALAPNEAALEFTNLALVDARPGAYRLLITVTDRLSGASATAERRFTVVP